MPRPRRRAPRRAGGLLLSLRRLGASLAALVAGRIGLAALEFEHEKARVTRLLLLGVVAVFFIGLGAITATIFIIVLFWDSHKRLVAIGFLTVVYVGIGLGAVALARKESEQAKRPFSADRPGRRRPGRRPDPGRRTPLAVPDRRGPGRRGGPAGLTGAVLAARRAAQLGATVQTNLDQTLATFEGRLRSVRALLAVIRAGILATLLGLILLAARLVVDRRADEYALIRARGGSAAAAGLRTLGETLAVVPPAVLAGWLLGAAVPGRADPGEAGTVILVGLVATLAAPVVAVLAARHPAFASRRPDLVTDEQRRRARSGIVPRLPDESPLEKRPDHPVGVDSPELRDLGPGERASVGDDRQDLEGRPGKPGVRVPQHEPLQPGGALGARVEAPAAGRLPQHEAPVVVRVVVGELRAERPRSLRWASRGPPR